MISVVVPVYNNEATLRELHERLRRTLIESKMSYECIFVDDGSADGSFPTLESLYQSHPGIKVIKLKKNFGQGKAMAAGFQKAQGAEIIVIDADLQYDPEEIPLLLAELKDGWQGVYGRRLVRQDHLLMRKIPSRLVNLFFKTTLKRPFEDIGCTFFAIRKEIAERFVCCGEMVRFSKPLLLTLTPKMKEIGVGHRRRKGGRSQYSWWRLWKMASDYLMHFSGSASVPQEPRYVIERILGR